MLKKLFWLPTTLLLLWREKFDNDWQPHNYKMRRWRNGRWEYREMTTDEFWEDMGHRNW